MYVIHDIQPEERAKYVNFIMKKGNVKLEENKDLFEIVINQPRGHDTIKILDEIVGKGKILSGLL